MFPVNLALLLAKPLLKALLKETVKAKVLQELREVAEDPRNRVQRGLVDDLEHAWDDFVEALADGLKR